MWGAGVKLDVSGTTEHTEVPSGGVVVQIQPNTCEGIAYALSNIHSQVFFLQRHSL